MAKESVKKEINKEKETKVKAKTKKTKTQAKVNTKVTTSKPDVSAKAKKSTTKERAKNTSVTKAASKKPASTKSNKKSVSTTSKNVKKTSSRKNTSKPKLKSTAKPMLAEYYDLPYRYNETTVKILAQTPTTLFVYWDISDDDRNTLIQKHGENVFYDTKPILIVHNITKNYSFEVEINDFANSWYLHVNDSKCDYHVELGRRPFVFNENIKKDYIPITVSNKIESPNDRVLLNLQSKTVCFRNLKTNEEIKRPITTFSFIEHKGSFTSIYDLYKKMYPKENIDEYFEVVKSTRLRNPSSSTFSSQFK